MHNMGGVTHNVSRLTFSHITNAAETLSLSELILLCFGTLAPLTLTPFLAAATDQRTN